MCQCAHTLMNKQFKIADFSLNIHNAEEKGYVYINDIPNLYKILNEIFEIATEKGYVIGAAESSKDDKYFGLYKKVKVK
jgi:hypothetical protein